MNDKTIESLKGFVEENASGLLEVKLTEELCNLGITDIIKAAVPKNASIQDKEFYKKLN